MNEITPEDLEKPFESPFDDQEFEDGDEDIEYPLPFKLGRPTSYRPSYCKKIIEWGRDGRNVPYMCAQLGIGKTTFKEWLNRHAEFGRAYEVSKCGSQNYYENLATTHLIEQKDGDKLNTNLYKMHMCAHYKEDYAQTTEVNLTTLDSNAPVPATITQTIDSIEQKIRGNLEGKT